MGVLLIHLVKLFVHKVLEVGPLQIHSVRFKRGPVNALQTLWVKLCVPRNPEEGQQSIRWGRPFARVGVSLVGDFRPKRKRSN